MEFIKMKNGKYLVKNSNGKIIDEKEKKALEKGALKIENEPCKDCLIKTTATSKKNNKKKKVEVEVVEDESFEETDFII